MVRQMYNGHSGSTKCTDHLFAYVHIWYIVCNNLILGAQ